MLSLSHFLSIEILIQYNQLNKVFYNKIIPQVFKNRSLYPSIIPELHLLIKDGNLWSLQFSKTVKVREIEFEDDDWRQDDQYVIADSSLGKLEKIVDFS